MQLTSKMLPKKRECRNIAKRHFDDEGEVNLKRQDIRTWSSL